MGQARTADQRLVAENNQLKKLLGEKALEMGLVTRGHRGGRCGVRRTD